MNEKKFEFLRDNIKGHGFGETLWPELEKQLRSGAAAFSLAYKTEINKKETEATLHFKKSDKTEYVFFNNYDVRVQTEKGTTESQKFYLNDSKGATLKEAYNLLNGRAVFKELTNKEDQKYKAWIQLDFSTKDERGNYMRKFYNENYGYALKETLSYYPIKELAGEDTSKELLRSLEKGNVQMVTFEKEGKDVRMFIEANPKYKDINVYTNRMVELKHDERKGLMVAPFVKEQGADKSLDAEKDLKQAVTKDEKKNLLPKKEKSNGPLEKKKTNRAKGLELK